MHVNALSGFSANFLSLFTSGFRQRRREVLWESSSSTETCPHLVESIPCEDPVCYLWQVQHEGTCIPSKSSCGPGTAVQNVTCISAEGTVLYQKGTVHIKIKILPNLSNNTTYWVFVSDQFGLLSAREYSEIFWHFGEYAFPFEMSFFVL